jgi:lysophospholipase L1-like esterase
VSDEEQAADQQSPGHARRKRGPIYAVVAILAITVLMLAGIEGLLALLMRFPDAAPSSLHKGMRAYYLQYDRDIIQYNGDIAAHDPDVSYLLKPGGGTFRNREYAVAVTANSQGIRDSETDLAAPDVICVGDSFCLGWGVADDEAYPALLQTADRKVLNAGMSSFGTVREMIMLSRLDRSALKTLIIQYSSNDVLENAEFAAKGQLRIMSPMQYKQIQDIYAKRSAYHMGRHLKVMIPLLARAGNAEDPLMKQLFDAPVSDSQQSDAQLFLQAVQAAPVNLAGVRIIVLEANPAWHPPTTFVADLGELAAQQDALDISVVSVADVLDESDFYTLDDHLNAGGHRKVADVLEKALKD